MKISMFTSLMMSLHDRVLPEIRTGKKRSSDGTVTEEHPPRGSSHDRCERHALSCTTSAGVILSDIARLDEEMFVT